MYNHIYIYILSLYIIRTFHTLNPPVPHKWKGYCTAGRIPSRFLGAGGRRFRRSAFGAAGGHPSDHP